MLHLLVHKGEISKDENNLGKGEMTSINSENGNVFIDLVSIFDIMKSERR